MFYLVGRNDYAIIGKLTNEKQGGEIMAANYGIVLFALHAKSENIGRALHGDLLFR